MNELQKKMVEKRTENHDVAHSTTGKSLTNLLFSADYFTKHLDEVKIGTTRKEKIFSMFVRDPRFGQGFRDFGRELMKQTNISPEMVVLAGRFDDLWKNPTDENLAYLKEQVYAGNELAKKWMPRLTGKDREVAKTLAKMWKLSQKKYRELIKVSTVEHKLSYAKEVKIPKNPLTELFDERVFTHPLLDEIDFEKVPSLAMLKYYKAFLRKEETSTRFINYLLEVKEDKAKLHTTTANVHSAYKAVQVADGEDDDFASEIIGRKIVEQEEGDVEVNAIVILDTSGSMTWGSSNSRPIDKANSVANSVASMSTYAKDYVISFSSKPQLLQVKGNTLKERYHSMYTGDCSNTDFGAVMELLKGLKSYPDYLIVLSDMEFDQGSNNSKKETMEIFKKHEAQTKIIWWNFNDRNRTVPELDEYGNIFLSGYNLSALGMLSLVTNMDEYLDKLLLEYEKALNLSEKI